MTSLKEIKIIWQYLQKYRKKVFFIATIALIGSILSAAIPYIYGRLVDIAVLESTSIKLILGILGIWFIFSLTANGITRYTDIKGADIATKASHDLILKGADHLTNLPISYHKDKKMGEVIQRLTRGGDFLLMIIENVAFSTIPNFLTVAVALVILILVEWRLALILFFVLLGYILITTLKTKPVVESHRKLNKAYEKTYGDVYDSIFNVQTVKSNTNEELELKKHTKGFRKIRRRRNSFIQTWVNLNFLQQCAFGFGFVIIFGISILLLRSKIISAGELVMFVGYINLTYQPLARLAHNYRFIRRGMTAVKRMLKLLKAKPEKPQKKKGLEVDNIKGEVEFKKVTFRYQKQFVLKNLSFKIQPGQIIALVGETGAGKTTLVDLISRYYHPTEGKILIDGYNIEKIDLECLRKNIAVVPQEIMLFNNSIKNNIKYGKPETSDKEMLVASKAANAHKFIQKFPKKYNQLVGERGIKLSTGQKQRVAIARALLRDPRILILDEATSSLDSKTEKLVQQALKRLIKGRTTFIIAHRLSTITEANKILVLKGGKIAESGEHQDLLKLKNGIYRNFYSLQSERNWKNE